MYSAVRSRKRYAPKFHGDGHHEYHRLGGIPACGAEPLLTHGVPRIGTATARPRARALSPVAPARERRLRLGLALPRRAERARGGAEDRAARGQGGPARRA